MQHRTPPKLLVALAVVCGLAVMLLAGRPPRAEDRAPGSQAPSAERLAARELGSTPLLDDLRELCNNIGGRPTGSKACDRAVDWTVGRFRDAGVDSVWTEAYTVPGSWEGGRDSAECLEPAQFPVRVASAPGTAATPGGRPLEAALVNAGDGSPHAFAALGKRARGAIALVLSPEMKTEDDLFSEYTRDGRLLWLAERAHVAALLIQSSQPGLLLYRHCMGQAGEKVVPIPSAIVARVQASRLAWLADQGEVRMRLDLPSRVGGPFQARNVVAEIRGREKPEEIVLMGAHLDSWDLGTGAEDNGINAMMMIDIARAFKALGLAPRRTVRFALFTGEEQGMLGSEAYVLGHAGEMERHVAMVTFDTGSGRISGFALNGREDLRRPVDQALAAVRTLQVTGQTLEAIEGTDNFDFLISGVPNLVAEQEWAPYLPNYHAESDVFDVVNTREAKTNAAVAAVLLWGLAESPDRPAPRQTRGEVKKLLRETKLEDKMKGGGEWRDFVSGKRGVSK